MNNSWINGAQSSMQVFFYKIMSFLSNIPYLVVFQDLIVILLGITLAARLLTLLLSFFLPNVFGQEHRRTGLRISRRAFLFSLVLQLLIWASGNQYLMYQLTIFDLYCCLGLICGAVLALLIALISMLFRRGGKRVFIAKVAMNQAWKMAVLALALLLFAWFFMDRTQYILHLFVS